MRFMIRSIGPLAVAILLAASLPAHAQQPYDQRDNDQPIVIGHRGASGYAPANYPPSSGNPPYGSGASGGFAGNGYSGGAGDPPPRSSAGRDYQPRARDAEYRRA